MGKDDNSYFDYKPENKRTNRMALFTSDKNTSENVQTRIASFCSDDSKSILAGSSIENYSILDIKNFKNINETTDDATSEASSIRQGNAISVSTENMKSAGILSKVIKKPVKDQIIDFNVPIYIDVKKKKTTMKPHALNTVNMKQYEISKTRSDKCDSLKANARIQSISKCTLPKTSISVSKKQVNSSKIMKNFADASTLTKYMDETRDDQTEYRMKDKYSERKAVSFSPEKKVVKNQKKNPVLISKCLQTESNENAKHCDCQTYTISTRRRIKVRDNLVDTDQKHEAKEDCSMESEARKKLNDKKIETKKQIGPSKVDRCKRCNYYDRCKSTRVLNDTKISESSNEDMMPVQQISMENNTCGTDHGRLLNVNIICQFYDEEDAKNPSIQDSQTVKSATKTPVKKTESKYLHISFIFVSSFLFISLNSML